MDGKGVWQGRGESEYSCGIGDAIIKSTGWSEWEAVFGQSFLSVAGCVTSWMPWLECANGFPPRGQLAVLLMVLGSFCDRGWVLVWGVPFRYIGAAWRSVLEK